jgi:uncharacterized protein with FMN-binding domain
VPPRIDDAGPGGPNAGQWLKGNLVGLGSAAVLAVYGAGYVRTSEAAHRFDVADAERRAAMPVRVALAEDLVTPPRPAPVAEKKDSATKPTEKPKKKAEAAPIAAVESKDTTPPARVDSVVAQAAPVQAAPAPQPAPAPTPTDTVSKSADPAQVGWKDGTYTGWGGSRHGDIQASIEIKNGRITLAWISICATNYSCSWVDALPAQVVARQSAEVDFVSGATQSTNAFYYAVVQALRKAK